jgi:hypothetical protein
MIKLDDHYYITADPYNFTLRHTKTVKREKNDPNGKYKKGDPHKISRDVSFHSSIAHAFNQYLKEVAREKISESDIMEAKDFIKWFKEIKEQIIKKFDIINGDKNNNPQLRGNK